MIKEGDSISDIPEFKSLSLRKERKKAMLKNANLPDKILSEKELSHTNLCLLIEKIIIHEDEFGLRLEIRMKAPFLEKSYTDEIGMIYEDDYEEVSA